MSTTQVLWAVAGIVAFLLLPVGAIRMIAYRSQEIDHTPTLRNVAVFALALGGSAFVLFIVLSIWFVATGQRPM
jgi:hypothetical protein